MLYEIGRTDSYGSCHLQFLKDKVGTAKILRGLTTSDVTT